MANPRVLEVDTAMGGVWVFGQLTPQSLMWLGFDGFLHRKTMGKPWENHRKMAVEWDLPSGQHLHKNELGEITMLFHGRITSSRLGHFQLRTSEGLFVFRFFLSIFITR